MATRKNYLERPNYMYVGVERENSITPTTDPFEFEEADVWSPSNDQVFPSSEVKKSIPNSRSSKKPVRRMGSGDRRATATAASLPVNVPDWSKILRDEYDKQQRREGEDNVEDSDDDDQDDRMPPHEYLARTRGASFSVHEGIGRTLKGRDLSRVRNAIWKQTGFED
ncbi:protein S40-4-like [Cornus florida]|uniref:protein S40-4-like n=1 Tax=Cornus florida TaxID=4283 RepID=UPI002898D71E|nr:protein S40-4-like [Cornus florida]